MKTFGWELILDVDECDIESIKSLDNISTFIDEVIEVTKMQKMGKLHSYYLEDTPEHREKGIIGWSIVQFIVTSSITIHFCEDPEKNYGTLYLNFFSCNAYDKEGVKDLVKKYFKGKLRNCTYLRRDASSSDFIVS